MERIKFKSIKGIIIKSFLIVILSTTLTLDFIIAVFIKKYHYNDAEELLKNQINIATNFYERYFSTSSLEENIYDNVDIFWNQTKAEVQIFNMDGTLLMDSIGVNDKNLYNYPDVKNIIDNNVESSRWIGKRPYYDYSVMSVSKPLTVNGKNIGIIRYTISLEDIDKSIRGIVMPFMFISIFAIIIGVILSLIIAKRIVKPIKDVNKVAEKMASGDLKIRNNMKGEDEIAQLARTLDYMAGELDKREQMKNEFISSVSHELRTPLTAIKGWVITLDSDQTDKETLSMGLKIIENETERLASMVEELLNFSALVNGRATLRKSKILVKDLIMYLETYMSERATRENKILTIKSNMENEFISIDVDKIKQVLINLIDNSFKFTESEGKITVEFIRVNEFMNIIVSDNGCGISESDLPRVTEKFYKGKNAKSQNGIGLSICDEITKLHKGTLKIESKENEGTRITISIPIEVEERG